MLGGRAFLVGLAADDQFAVWGSSEDKVADLAA
jgi:hypothetical protein